MNPQEVPIDRLIPQRDPFVFIDKLLACTASKSETSFEVKPGHMLVEGNALTAEGLVENIAQTAAAGLGYRDLDDDDPDLGYIGAISNLTVHSLPEIGEVINTQVTVEKQVFNATIATGTIFCNGTEIANCQLKIFVDDK